MKNRISIVIFLLLISLNSWAQIGGDYNPTNPTDPGNPTQEYTLTLKSTPTNGGSFNISSTNIAGGKTYTLRAYPNSDFAFVAWICNGDTLSRSTSYTYTMPFHDVEMIGAFIYSPSNPSDPNIITPKHKLTLKAVPTEGGSFNTTSTSVSEGEKYNLRAYPNTDFAFQAWICNGDTLSKSASYDYVMPTHDVDITGIFTYRPSSPSDPQEQALKYQLSISATPINSGSFNISNERLTAGSKNSLRAYSNTDFVFRHWMIGDSVLSSNSSLEYVMPPHNVQMVGVFEYNPTSPANPNRNHWDKNAGEVIVDDFTPGNLSSAISSVISGSSSKDVQIIIVAGKMNSNDFGIANTYSNCTLLDLSRVTGVSDIPSYAFDYTNLQMVYLPASIEEIGDRAFAECPNLTSITIYAMTPPTLGSNVFYGIPEGLVVYVPAAAIAQYQDVEAWDKFTLLPIQEDIRNISISLPEGTNVTDYSQMWLELTNTKSGQKMHYVMTDRSSYTFSNIIRNTSWNAVLRNQRGDVFGKIENIEVKDEDVSVVFSSLSKPQNVSLTVKTPNGETVTSNTQITWLDSDGNYLAQSTGLSGLLSGYAVNYRVVLSQDLAMQYVAPEQKDYIVSDANNNLTLTLEPIKQVTISGCVKDLASRTALGGATVTASQTFGGKYSKTVSTKTDAKGNYVLTVSNVPTSLAVSASDYISQTIVCDSLLTGVDVVTIPDVSLKGISGAVVTLGLTYTKCPSEDGDEDTFQEWYADYNNVAYDIFNKTKQKAINQFNVQYPQIVLLEEVDEGDVLEMTATSKVNAFMPVKTTATIDAEQRANASFNIVELGKIKSAFAKNSNASVVGSLYDANGKLVKSYDYSNASLTINDLTDGSYTLVTMGASKLFNSIYDLSQLPQTGLVLGSDYTQTTVDVKSGKVCAIDIAEVPTLDESKLYYTGENTSFTVNKSSIVAGNYLTLTGHLDFKSAYAANVSNVNLIVDLPESCEFVENSVMVGNNTSSYIIQDNRITIPMARYTDRVRFCIIPTLGGEYAPSALAQFDINGETITQPIGNVRYEANNLSIKVPSTVANTTVPISGSSIGKSNVEIFDNGVLVGQTNSLGNGTWSTTIELNDTYNLSLHNIYAIITTSTGLQLSSETKEVSYDKNAVQVSKVTMYHWNPEMSKMFESIFDFQNPSTKPNQWTVYYPNKKFTYTVDFTNNSPEKVSNVILYVHAADGKIIPLHPTYDAEKDIWVADIDMGNRSDNYYPVNVSVDFDCLSEILVDRKPFDEISNKYNLSKVENKNLQDSINALLVLSEETIVEGQNKQEEIDSLLTLLNSPDSSDNEINTIISRLSEIAGFNITAEELEITLPEMSDSELEDFIANLVEECDSLLSNNTGNIDEYISNMGDLFAQTDSLIEEDLMIDIEESFSSIESDTIVIEDDNVVIRMHRINLDEFNVPLIDSTQISVLPLTDGHYVKIYFDEDNTFIVDSINGNVWAIEGISSNDIFEYDLPNLNSKIRKARISSDIIENLKKAGSILEKIASRLTEIGSSLTADLKGNIERLDNFIKNLEKESESLAKESQVKGQRLSEIRQKLSTLKKKKVYRSYLQQEIDALEAESKTLANDIKRLDNLKSNAQSRIAKLKSTRLAKVALLSEVTDYVLLANNARKLVTYIWKGISDYGKWSSFINTILPCDNDYQNAHTLKYMATDARDAYLREYGKAAGLSGLSTFIAGFMTFNKAAKGLKFIFKLGIGILNDFLGDTSESIFNNALNASKQRYAKYVDEREKLKCKKDPDPNPNPGGGSGGGSGSGAPDDDVKIDPSGFVYEGVFSNRLEGVTATAYYKEMVEDMYGDLHENIVKWDAEEYAQENPLFTDENGYYRWDVPQGLWQVKFEKEGYETTYSEWLPVPPPQLDVNIAMRQNVQPNVKNARAYEDAVEVEFDKYMMPELLNTDNIILMAGDKQVEGTIELLNEEAKYEGESETFASKVRFNADAPFEGTEVTLMVNNRVKSYAGIRMQDNYSQSFTIEQEIRKIVCDSATVIGYGHSGFVPVTVLPASASAGKVLNVNSSSSMILATDITSIKLDENGFASISVNGELPGTAALTFSIDGYDLSATTIVNVEQIENVEIEAPRANIASGTTVTKGTSITLSCATEGATIYYTLDGSCPCDEATRLTYTEPIVINKTVTIKAMAVAPDMTESDIVEFTYFVTTKVEVPTASLPSGSSVYRGTTVKLSSESKDMKIWYTTDGTCPCDENGSRKQYTEPIAINSDVTIKSMAENAYGDASDVVTFVYSILQSKTGVSLADGWNWVSFNMKNEALSSVNTAMASGSWTSDDVIKDNKYVDMYSVNQKKWIGTLSKQGALKNTQMYKVHSSKAQTVELSGEAVNPAETSITVGSGWNYISYLPLVSMSVSEALSNYAAQSGDVIKSQDAFATYSTTNGWEGDLTALTVGRGYMLKRGANASQVSFTYPVESPGSSVKAPASAKSYRYADNMNIIGEVEGFSVEDGDSLVAYVNGEIRGASRLERNHKVFLTVHGEEDARMTIVLVREGTIIATASNIIGYQSNNVLGTSDAPTAITFITDDRNLDGTIGNVKAIYSINGIKMNTRHLNNIPSGTYIIYYEKNGKTCVSKFIK